MHGALKPIRAGVKNKLTQLKKQAFILVPGRPLMRMRRVFSDHVFLSHGTKPGKNKYFLKHTVGRPALTKGGNAGAVRLWRVG